MVLGQPDRIPGLTLGLRARTSAAAGCGAESRVLKPAQACHLCTYGYNITRPDPPWSLGEEQPQGAGTW